jgi:NAD(P)H-hydrate epimerase
MKILSANQIREVDKYTIEHEPISSADLMERASLACSDWIVEHYPKSQTVKIFVGPGNNGGDGLCIAYFLLMAGFHVQAYVLYSPERMTNESMQKFQRLMEFYEEAVFPIQELYTPEVNSSDLVIDALFGTGLTRALSGYPSLLIGIINKSGAETIAIDVPSGLFCDSNEGNNRDTIIRARHTLTFQAPKLAFMFAENYGYTGDVHVLDIKLHPDAIEEQESKLYFQQVDDFEYLLKTRKKFDHKGVFGHALLIAGSYGKMGAAVLASRACLRTGVGLLTTHVPRKGYEIIQTTVPESMVSLDINEELVSELPYNDKFTAMGVGPGIGTSHETTDTIRELLSKTNAPIVMDADALNILSQNQWLLCMVPPLTILTPHPKEFDRLAGENPNGYKRFQSQLDFSRKYNVIIVLKGAYTSITTPDGEAWFNSTGNPGMATAGSGDVLTGIILSLLAQGYEPIAAARLGVYLHGLAGDIALTKNSYESIVSGDIINHIGNAFNKIRYDIKN